MAEVMSVNVSSAWKTVSLASVNVSGSWKSVYTAWVNVGGTWKVTFRSVQLIGDNTDHTRVGSGSTIVAGVYMNSDGEEWAYSSAGAGEGDYQQDWLLVGAAGDYWVEIHVNSGTLGGGQAEDTWLRMNVTRGFFVQDPTSADGAETIDFDLQLAAGSGGTPLLVSDTNYTCSANRIF